ncbi:MAG TPA: hypothetical protein PKZ76_09490, partial [Xanthomonadaceae bacterium]|nr:hypothetical protein [Xanthomonadaceae bacterium]
LHLCKGCVALAVGLIFATTIVLTVGGAWCVWALALVGPVTIALSWPPFYQRLPRGLRDLLRMGAGATFALAAWVAGSYPSLAWPLLPALLLLWWLFRHSRKKVIAARCNGCPELHAPGVCSGYALQAACARALEDEIEARMGASLAGGVALPPGIGRAPGG